METDQLMPADTGFAGFVLANRPTLMRTAYMLTGSAMAAEELVQNTLAGLYPKWSLIENAGSPVAYVRRSLINRYRDEQRRVPTREVLTDVVPERPTQRSHENDLADRDEVRVLLRPLSPRQRAVLVMRYYEGLDDVQIAAALGCQRGNVRSIAHRALAKIRQSAA